MAPELDCTLKSFTD